MLRIVSRGSGADGPGSNEGIAELAFGEFEAVGAGKAGSWNCEKALAVSGPFSAIVVCVGARYIAGCGEGGTLCDVAAGRGDARE